MRSLAVAILVALPASAAGDLGPTLQKIKESGIVAVGHRESSIPFSYYDDRQQVVGYSQDFALAIVDALKKELNAPSLQVKLVPVTSQNRIPLVQNGTVDIECGSTTNNLERQQQVAFSNSLFIVRTRLLTRKNSGVKDVPDLAGKNAVVTAGTTSERLLRKLNEEKKLGIKITSAKDHGESFLILESGRAAAFMLDDVLLFGELAKARNRDDWTVTGTPQSREAYGCSMRKGDAKFKAVVDETVARLETSGEAEKIYAKWFLHPIPPKGLNLNFPLSDEMKALFKNPNDKALE
ncbi:MAG: glutamate/aspartate ABC transporter substrate-binding protein [Myxococcales bacterium]|jgi:glutamate/aspartate transport system substrate-binding protein